MAGQWDHEVVVIGGGMSGICMGVTLRREGIEDFVILEKSEDVGGTWLDNSYPGACCDVPSVLYSFSFEPNPDWSRRYSPQAEIQAYFAHCVDKYGLRDKLRLGCAVESARYIDAEGGWEVQLAGGETLRAPAGALPAGLLNVMIEIRNDLISTPQAQSDMGQTLSNWIEAALAHCGQNACQA